MKANLINYLKNNSIIYSFIAFLLRLFFNTVGLFCQTKKRIVFMSFGGRKFDDSPLALYNKIINDKFFDDYEIYWVFCKPNEYKLIRGKTIKVDSFKFFIILLTSKIWISNTMIDRGIGIRKKGVIRVETWHGTPLKKICGEENIKSFKTFKSKKTDNHTIRCAQSVYDQNIFARVFNSTKESILLCDLPRNDELINNISAEKRDEILTKIGAPLNKKIILYIPTYREYLKTKRYENYIAPPINLRVWEEKLGCNFILLFRAHYAVNKVLGIKNNGFVFDVSTYDRLNDLFQICDILISDYSSAFFDFSIKERPMFCFAYDLEEYSEKRGLYLDIEKDLFLKVFRTENNLLDQLMDNPNSIAAKRIKKKYAPNAGNACSTIISEIKKRLLCKK